MDISDGTVPTSNMTTTVANLKQDILSTICQEVAQIIQTDLVPLQCKLQTLQTTLTAHTTQNMQALA